jgi:hypothetical protein
MFVWQKKNQKKDNITKAGRQRKTLSCQCLCVYIFVSESIELFIEDHAFSRSYDSVCGFLVYSIVYV